MSFCTPEGIEVPGTPARHGSDARKQAIALRKVEILRGQYLDFGAAVAQRLGVEGFMDDLGSRVSTERLLHDAGRLLVGEYSMQIGGPSMAACMLTQPTTSFNHAVGSAALDALADALVVGVALKGFSYAVADAQGQGLLGLMQDVVAQGPIALPGLLDGYFSFLPGSAFERNLAQVLAHDGAGAQGNGRVLGMHDGHLASAVESVFADYQEQYQRRQDERFYQTGFLWKTAYHAAGSMIAGWGGDYAHLARPLLTQVMLERMGWSDAGPSGSNGHLPEVRSMSVVQAACVALTGMLEAAGTPLPRCVYANGHFAPAHLDKSPLCDLLHAENPAAQEDVWDGIKASMMLANGWSEALPLLVDADGAYLRTLQHMMPALDAKTVMSQTTSAPARMVAQAIYNLDRGHREIALHELSLAMQATGDITQHVHAGVRRVCSMDGHARQDLGINPQRAYAERYTTMSVSMARALAYDLQQPVAAMQLLADVPAAAATGSVPLELAAIAYHQASLAAAGQEDDAATLRDAGNAFMRRVRQHEFLPSPHSYLLGKLASMTANATSRTELCELMVGVYQPCIELGDDTALVQATLQFALHELHLGAQREKTAQLAEDMGYRFATLYGCPDYGSPHFLAMLEKHLLGEDAGLYAPAIHDLHRQVLRHRRDAEEHFSSFASIIGSVDLAEDAHFIPIGDTVYRMTTGGHPFVEPIAGTIAIKVTDATEVDALRAVRAVIDDPFPMFPASVVGYKGGCGDQQGNYLLLLALGQGTLAMEAQDARVPLQDRISALLHAGFNWSRMPRQLHPEALPGLFTDDADHYVWTARVAPEEQVAIPLRKTQLPGEVVRKVLGKDTDAVQRSVPEGAGYVVQDGTRVYVPGQSKALDWMLTSLDDYHTRGMKQITDGMGRAEREAYAMSGCCVLSTNPKLENFLADGTMIDFSHLVVGDPMFYFSLFTMDPRMAALLHYPVALRHADAPRPLEDVLVGRLADMLTMVTPLAATGEEGDAIVLHQMFDFAGSPAEHGADASMVRDAIIASYWHQKPLQAIGSSFAYAAREDYGRANLFAWHALSALLPGCIGARQLGYAFTNLVFRTGHAEMQEFLAKEFPDPAHYACAGIVV
ncbi:hypothetical protein AUJ68_06400 [Candidatus Woesearchaeota archaeon CG1_02_57_44]|nr:MAG: hypothetical protein AUJ68_06400 [Candidatus Woesearchaeota archaeon CG1_02_57_44]